MAQDSELRGTPAESDPVRVQKSKKVLQAEMYDALSAFILKMYRQQIQKDDYEI